MNTEQDDNTIYYVVVNDEEQYSIWPDYRQIPAGWRSVGKTGPKQDCLDYIKEVWTDMRPLSLRRQMEQQAQQVQ
jgi:MbtH protein